MRGKIFIVAIVCFLMLSFWPYFPLIYDQKPSAHDPYDKVKEDTIVPGIDSDGDLLKDIDEISIGTNPLAPDTDGDGLRDGEEYEFWRDRYNEENESYPAGLLKWLKDRHPNLTPEQILNQYKPTGDLDGDGLSNILDADSDGDGLGDGYEIQIYTDPANPDTDGDGVSDRDDPKPTNNTIDETTGISEDWLDFYNLTDPFGDPDHDGKSNIDEYKEGTSPVYPGDDLDELEQDFVDINSYFDSNFSKILFFVEPIDNPRYWRLTAFDTYNHDHWSQYDLSNSTVTSEISPEVTTYKSSTVYTYNITFWGAYHGLMPTALNSIAFYDVELDPKIYSSATYTPVVYLDDYGGFSVREYVRKYSFAVKEFEYDQEMLVGAKAVTGSDISNYLALPDNMPVRVLELSNEITKGMSSPYLKAQALAKFLRSNFTYSLTPPIPEKANTDMVDWFMFETGEGKCTEFTSAFVVMARMLDIPTRFATGFAVGNEEIFQDGNNQVVKRVVRAGHKHAWPEIKLEGVGWIPFEVTAPYSDLGESTGVNTTGQDDTVHTDNGTGGSGTEYDPSSDVSQPDADPDNDGLTNAEEAQYGTDPLNPDTDQDTLNDGPEVNTYGTDPLKPDTDSDGLTDPYELNTYYLNSAVDWNDDGLRDYRTNPLNPDSDNGGMLDGAEVWNDLNPLDPLDDAMHDSDGDGLSDELELTLGTDPLDRDSDDDNLNDGMEYYTFHTDPLVPDTDEDGILDGEEVILGEDGYITSPRKDDTDDDGLLDGAEISLHLTDPTDPDTDNDALTDGLELDSTDGYTTDPLNPDTDSDSLSDGKEDRNKNGKVDAGAWNGGDGPGEADPLNPDTDGGGLPDGTENWIGNNPLDPADDTKTGDTDNDGLSDIQEAILGTNITDFDTDDDGLLDGAEVYEHLTDPNNPDSDSDGISDGEELHLGADGYITNPLDSDTDNDSLEDGMEIDELGTDPTNIDTDDDGLNDGFEIYNDFNLTKEGLQNTDPLNPDTDDGGVYDGTEYYNGLDPTNSTDDILLRDTDNDMLTDEKELELGTNVTNPDTDGDNLMDGKEVLTHDTNPLDKDSDDDGLFDGEEVVTGADGYVTDPNNNDTDSDSLNDSYEVSISMTNPTKSDTDDDSLSDALEIDGTDGIATNPNKWDTDSDLLPDGWRDTNGNGIIDLGEYEDRNLNGRLETGSWNGGDGPGETDPTKADTDGGGALDSDEIFAQVSHNPLDSTDDADIIDTDRDGLTDLEEDKNSNGVVDPGETDPKKADTDDDGIGDKEELIPGSDGYITDPLNPDSDNDTIFDGEEVKPGNDGYITNPLNNDTDNDTLTDPSEIFIHDTDPTKNDTDGDGLLDNIEVGKGGRSSTIGSYSARASGGTDPSDSDSDDDGLPDGFIDGWGYNHTTNQWGKFGTGAASKDGKPTIGLIEGSFIYAEGEDRNLNGIAEAGPWNGGLGPGETDNVNNDTDGGGALDGLEIIEISLAHNPLDPSDDSDLKDTDRDGLTDEEENSTTYETVWNNPDTDSDGLWDGYNVDVNFDGTIDNLGELESHNGYSPTFPVNPDSDTDGLLDGVEVKIYFTDPRNEDTDNDGLWDGYDIGTNLGELDGHYGYDPTNPLKPDTDNDTLWDGLTIDYDGHHTGELDDDIRTDPNNPDTDGDELRDNEELMHGTDPTNWDTDGGSVGDGVELFRIPKTDPLDPSDDIPQDTDGDGLLNSYENNTYYTITAVDWYLSDGQPDHYTSWLLNDTDNDGLLDGEEVNNFKTQPLYPDTDVDGLPDGMEAHLGPDPNSYISDPANSDTDGDGLPDGWIDINKNGKPDPTEFEDRNLNGIVDPGTWNDGEGPGETDPTVPDTDGGGSSDLDEIMRGTNPLNPSDDLGSGKSYLETQLAAVDYPAVVNKTVEFIVKGSVLKVEDNTPVHSVPVEVYTGFKTGNFLAATGTTDDEGKFALTSIVPSILEVGEWQLFIRTRAVELDKVIYNGTENQQIFNITVKSGTRPVIEFLNSPVAINSVFTLDGTLYDASNLTIANETLQITILLQPGGSLDLGTITSDQWGKFFNIYDATEDNGFILGVHSLVVSYGGSEYLASSNRTINLEILADVSDLEITVEPRKQVVGRFIWVNGTIGLEEGPPPTGTLEVNLVRITSGFTITESILLNGSLKFNKQVLLSSDLNADQYRVFVKYSVIETSNAVTITVVGLADFMMDEVKVHRGDPPVTITAALVDNSRAGLVNSPVAVEFEGQYHSLITDSEGKVRFQYEASSDHELGAVPVTLTFTGDDKGHVQHLGITVIRNIAVTSPSFIFIDSYTPSLNRSDDLKVTGRVLDDLDEGVPNARILVYVSHIYLHETTADENGHFSLSKALTKSVLVRVKIGLRTLDLDFVGDDKYENSTKSELISIYDEPWLDFRTISPLAPSEPFRAVVELRDPNGVEFMPNVLLEVRLPGEEPIKLITNTSGKIEFQAIFPKDSDTLEVNVRYPGESDEYLLPIDKTYTLSVPGAKSESQMIENINRLLPIIVALFLVGAVILYWNRWRRRHIMEIREIITEMAEELETADEIRKVIYKAYGRMLEVLTKYGFMRRDSDTPREFAIAVRKALPGIDRKHLHGLTRLFEEARYSDHKLTAHERFRAIRSLKKVKTSLEKMPPRPSKPSIRLKGLLSSGDKTEA
jgi:transglutaminase-like putative cysteine protease